MIFFCHRELPATRKKKESLKLSCWLRSKGWSYFFICDPLKSFPHILSAFRSANLASVQLDINKLCSMNKRRNWKIHHTKLMAPWNPNIHAYIYMHTHVHIHIYFTKCKLCFKFKCSVIPGWMDDLGCRKVFSHMNFIWTWRDAGMMSNWIRVKKVTLPRSLWNPFRTPEKALPYIV